MNGYRQYIIDTYEWALRNKIVRNQREFAGLVGFSYATMSLILNGNNKSSGKTVAAKVRAWMDANYPNKEQVSIVDYERGYNAALKDQDEFDWVSFRRQAAKDILCARLSNNANHMNFDYSANRVCDSFSLQNYVGEALSYADELIRQLKNE